MIPKIPQDDIDDNVIYGAKAGVGISGIDVCSEVEPRNSVNNCRLSIPCHLHHGPIRLVRDEILAKHY